MFSLVIIVISIGLMAAVIATTINYVPMDAQLRHQMFKDAQRGLESLECAVTRFIAAPVNSDSSGAFLYPGDGVDVLSRVAPQYGFMPADVRKEMTWELRTGQVSGMPAVGICLRPKATSTPMQREVLAQLKEKLPKGSTYVGASCNATADVAVGTSLTYWVVAQHIN